MSPCMFCFPNFCRKSNKSGYSYALMLASIQALCLHKNWVSARNSYFTPFWFPPVPANPPTCWRIIVSCRKKKANEIRHVLPPRYQAATTHSTTLSILLTFQSQRNVISTMQGLTKWLNFGDGTGQLTASIKPNLVPKKHTPLNSAWNISSSSLPVLSPCTLAGLFLLLYRISELWGLPCRAFLHPERRDGSEQWGLRARCVHGAGGGRVPRSLAPPPWGCHLAPELCCCSSTVQTRQPGHTSLEERRKECFWWSCQLNISSSEPVGSFSACDTTCCLVCWSVTRAIPPEHLPSPAGGLRLLEWAALEKGGGGDGDLKPLQEHFSLKINIFFGALPQVCQETTECFLSKKWSRSFGFIQTH